MRLVRPFYARETSLVARDLIGKILFRESPDGVTSGRIVEAEAYTGESDPASHAFRGPTRRNGVMFGPPGYLYVYLSYGMHVCCNVVTESEGIAGAVLLRAVEPLEGVEHMLARRGPRPIRQLANGPGKLCQALGITLIDYGADLTTSSVGVADDGRAAPDVAVGGRVGISAAADLPRRYFVPGSPFVSSGKPAS